MSSYYPNGRLTTNKQTIDDVYSWDSQAEWSAFQSATRVDISNGVISLAENLIESFESGSLDGYGGDLARFTTFSGFATDGSLGLTGSGGTTQTGYRIQNGDLTVESGNTYRFDFQTTNNWIFMTLFGVPNDTEFSCYELVVNPNLDEFHLRRRDNGSVTSLSGPNSSVSIDEGTQYTGEFVWNDDGSLIFRLLDSSGSQIGTDATASDATYSSGGIGFRIYNDNSPGSGSVDWDYVRVV